MTASFQVKQQIYNLAGSNFWETLCTNYYKNWSFLTELQLFNNNNNGIFFREIMLNISAQVVLSDWIAPHICLADPSWCSTCTLSYILSLNWAVASAVLTATGLVNGKGPFLTPSRESTSQNRSPKHLSQVIMSTILLLCKIWWKSIHGGFWANRWNITRFFHL